MTDVLNFGDIYHIKEFMTQQIAPKYFDMADVNQFNVGLLGYTTELASVTTEESFNAMNTMFKEIFVTKASFPETLYTKAGIYDVDSTSALAAQTKSVLYINERDIIRYGEFDGEVYDFVIDKHTTIEVDNIPYTLDYDIHIIARPDRGDMIFTAQYDLSEPNTISTIKHQFIKVSRHTITNTKYVALLLDNVRQYARYEREENLITSNNINFPTISIEYDDQFAGMDIYYRTPGESKFSLLTKRIAGTTPLKSPFIYYRHLDKGRLELSFTTRDNYFKPDFNSELKVVVYTTLGAGGNFKKYDGDVNVISRSEDYDYNRSIMMIATVLGSSTGGADDLTLEDLRLAIIEKKASSGAYNNESDLEMYFNNRATRDMDKVFLKFIKRRDDLVERLFSCMGLFKDSNGDYFHTNTLHLKLHEKDFDKVYDNGNRFILKPGRYMKYSETDNKTLEVCGHCSVSNGGAVDNEFLFANPFLISFQKNPNSISFYQNCIDSTHSLEYKHNEHLSKYQFMINDISVKRNSVIGDNSYTVTTTMKPVFDIILDEVTGEPDFGMEIKVVLSSEEDGGDTKAVVMEMVDYSPETNVFTYEYVFETDDEINSNEKIIMNNIYDVHNGIFSPGAIPMIDSIFNVCIMAKDNQIKRQHPFSNIVELADYKMVSKYGTDTDRITFMKPMKFMRSRVNFFQYVAGIDPETEEAIMDYYSILNMVPVVGQSVISNESKLMEFISEVEYVYDYISEIMALKTNNYTLDMKFYNTYGRSNNFIVGEEANLLDRTNIDMKIQVALKYGAIADNEIYTIKEYIKDYVENINKARVNDGVTKGYNGIYISNLIQELENNINNLRYMKFVSINDYDSSVQVIENRTTNIEEMTDVERREYVVEYLTIGLDDISVEVL